jgi:hypothetical protein
LDRASVLVGWLRPVDSPAPFHQEPTVHAVTERPFLLQVVTVFGGLVAGPFFGHHMGVWLTRRPGPEGLSPSDRVVPAGYRSYAILGLIGGVLVGLLAGLTTELALATGLMAWTLFGLAYGGSLSLAAHHGWLPFPEPE